MFKIPEGLEFYGRALISLRSCVSHRQLPFVKNKRLLQICCKTFSSPSPPPFIPVFSKISWCRSRLPRVATKTFGSVRYSGRHWSGQRHSVRYGAGNSGVREAGGRPGSLATVGVIPFFDNDHPRTASTRYHTLPSASPVRSPPDAPYLPTPQSLRADLGSV